MGVSAVVATRPLASLSVDEVCGLLHAMGSATGMDFGQYDAGFRAHSYCGIVLRVAREKDLEKVPNRP